MSKVSIVIPTFNKISYTKRCLSSVLKNTPNRLLEEIIVVDNHSTDGTVSYLKRKGEIKCIINKKNLGFSKACNQGARLARGKYILFLNNDTEVKESWLDPLVRELDSNDDIAIVGSKLLFPDGFVQHAGIIIRNDNLPWHIYYRAESKAVGVNKKREFKAVTAACLLIRRDVFEEVGGFDEEFINGFEDVDLCLRVNSTGKKIAYVPKSIIVHHESVSEGRHDNDTYNAKLFLKKWGGKIQQDDYFYYLADNPLEYVSTLLSQLKEKDDWINHLEKDIVELRKEILLCRGQKSNRERSYAKDFVSNLFKTLF